MSSARRTHGAGELGRETTPLTELEHQRDLLAEAPVARAGAVQEGRAIGGGQLDRFVEHRLHARP